MPRAPRELAELRAAGVWRGCGVRRGRRNSALNCAAGRHVRGRGTGDADLYAAIKPIGALAGKTADTFSAVGEIGVSGTSCAVSSIAIAAEASVSINVSIQASASVQGKAST